MKNLIKIIILTLVLASCKDGVDNKPESIGNKINESKDFKETEIAKEPKVAQVDLKSKIKDSESNCLDFNNLSLEFENTDYSDKLINRQSENWIYELEKRDSMQFERADLLALKCKVFENKHIVSVAFVDLYDYKMALHLFTFKKPEFEPTSSFVFYQIGGDVDDFWNITFEKIGDLKYIITEESGYKDNIANKNPFFKGFRETREYSIDSTSGKINKKILKTEKAINDKNPSFQKIINDLGVKKIPLIDSTNFYNFSKNNFMGKEAIKTLQLETIYPNFYKEGYHYKSTLSYKIELSEKFYSIIINTLKGEHEIESILINYSLSGKLIDYKIISYDEIAEGWSRILSKIEKRKLTVTNITFTNEKQETIEVFEITKSGKINEISKKKDK